MYDLNLKYFNQYGYLLDSECIMVPGKSEAAIREYVTNMDMRSFCGLKPAVVYAAVEGMNPILIKLGGNVNENDSIRRWLL